MRSSLLTAVLFLGGLADAAAVTCTCPGPRSIESALRHSTLVVLANAISIEQQPTRGDSTGRFVTETASFKIMESWKGPYRRGATIAISSPLGPGACGMSARNDPPWLDSIDPATHAVRHPAFSGLWILYASGNTPYEISMCSRSTPFEYGGRAEMKTLYRLKFARAHSRQPPALGAVQHKAQ